MIMMKKTRPTTVLQNLIVVLLCLTVTSCVSGSVNWLQNKSLGYQFYVGEDVDINCNLSDPKINVTLWLSKGSKSPYVHVVPNDHIKQFGQVFRLSAIQAQDHGEYQCRAENMTDFNVLTVHVFHGGKPKPKPTILVGKVEYGKDATLKCSAYGAAVLNWYKGKPNGTRKDWQWVDSSKQLLPSAVRRNSERSLTIKKFNISDNGVYICELERKHVKWWTYVEKYVGIKDLRKPTFTEFKLTYPGNVQEGYELDVTYKVEGSPPSSIVWYKVNDDAKEVLLAKCNESEYYCNSAKDIDSTRYYFTKYKLLFPNDNTTFKCVASNFLGTATKTLRPNVLAKPKIVLNKNQRKLIHVYKSKAETEIVCMAVKANPSEIKFTWEAQLTDCTNTDCKPNNSNWQVVTGTDFGLKIVSNNGESTLSLKQIDQHSLYRCTADNGIGKDQYEWTVILVTGQSPLKAEKELVEVDEEEDVKLACEVARLTSSQIYWLFNDVDVQLGSRLRVENSSINGTVYNTLHITKVNITDAGKYKCFGDFNGKFITAEIVLKVQELEAPMVSLRKLTKKQNSSFLVRCGVSGHPKPQITWKKNGKVLKIVESVSGANACTSRLTGIYMLSSEEKDHATVLVICRADYKKHLGEFSCTARNRLGNDTAGALINITAPPTISKFPSIQAKLGETFTLKCVASGNPKPRVWWEKKDELTFKPVEHKQSDKLHFDAVDKSNIGVYRCFAENGFKTETKDFSLVIELQHRVAASTGVAPNNSKYAVVIGCVSFFIVLIVIVVAVVLYKRKKIYGGFYILTLPPLPDYIKKLDPHTPLTEQTNKLPYDAEWEFPRNRLKFSRELGAGAFGKVFLADALGIVAFDPRGSTKKRSSRRRFGGSVRRNHYVNNNKMTKVAVKTLKDDSGETEYKDLLSELKILIHVGEHKNIVNLLGACTKGRESELWVIIEFCSNGNLLQFLRNRRDIYETEWKGVSKDPNVQLTMTDLVIAAYQVARGMEFLASRLCIHRDLATRNILVTDNYVIKIADFGLARDVGQDSQYVKTSTGLLPVKWMAIEAIIQRLFTEKSDVWSFGIVLWELFTLGGTPYPNIPPNEVAEFLARGLRMEPPHACPDEISTLMLQCWHDDKDCRPSFKELVEILDKIIELHTSSEGGRGYLEVQGEMMNEYLSPSEVKSPQMDPFECNSPLPPIPSPGENECDSLLLRDQNSRGKKFHFDKAVRNKAARQDSEIEKMQNDHTPEIIKYPDVQCRRGNELDGYIDTSLTGKEKERIERDLEKERDSSEEPQHLGDYAYWKKSLV